MSDRYFVHVLPNGLVLVAERMAGVSSAAMSLLLPAGASVDPPDRLGTATVLAELVLRGAGSRDSRQLSNHLDRLGLQRSSGAGVYHTRFGCAAIAARVLEGLETYADIVQRPHLPADGFEPARELALQALAGLEDDPRSQVLIRLREVHWPQPLGRNAMGDVEHLEALTLEDVKAQWQRSFRPRGSILAVAGNIAFDELRERVERTFGGWTGEAASPTPAVDVSSHRDYQFAESEQTHIGIAWDSVPETHDDYYCARLACEVLSGGMSGRLFTEVREKRGLCYSVGASYSGLKDRASLLGYAGTTPDRAQATLDQFLVEVGRLADGITREELDRAKIGLKANTIMSGESTGARAGAIAYDYFARGRVRTLEEIKQAIDAVTLECVNAHLARTRPGRFTIVIVGPKELQTP